MGVSQSTPVIEKLARLEERSKVSRIFAWGRNSGSQCGIGTTGDLLCPHEIKALRGKEVTGLYAGRYHSGAVLSDNSVYSWGTNTNGRLGIGEGGQSRHRPQKLLAFDGFGTISSMALGGGHSLFVDVQGNLWAAGEDGCGQLGLGAPLSWEWVEHDRSPTPALPALLVTSELRQRMGSMGLTGPSLSASVAHLLAPATPERIKQGELQRARDAAAAGGHDVERWANCVAAAAAGVGEADLLLNFQGIRNSQYHTPLRVGRQLHELFGPRDDAVRAVRRVSYEHRANVERSLSSKSPAQLIDLLQDLACVDDPLGAPRGAGLAQGGAGAASCLALQEGSPAPSLADQCVVKAAAGKTFSMALTGDGRVWMFGYGESDQLGNGNLIQTDPRPVTGRIARLIADNGGAVDVAAGGAFCLALARNGAVVVWGKPAPDGMLATAGGLPPMSHIAAGKEHAVMSDGETVWSVKYDTAEPATLPSRPRVVRFEAAPGGVSKLAAGGHASAVVDDAGRLWMWGRLVELKTHDVPLESASGHPVAPCMAAHERHAKQVEGLEGVRDAALGAEHVLVAVES